MPTIKRLLLAVSVSIFVSAAVQATTPHYVENATRSTIDAGGQIISFAQQAILPPQPRNPSTIANIIQQFQIHNSSAIEQGIYFTFETSALPGFPYERCYSVEVTGNTGGVMTDPIAQGYAFPGDTITWYWFGVGDPNETAHGAPYVEIKNDNASGMQASGWDKIVNYTGPYMDSVLEPYVEITADPTWSPPFTNFERNCWGDLPAANQAGNVSRTRYMDYYVTADHVVHFATFQAGGYQDPIFANYAGTSIPGCNLTIATPTAGTVTYSDVSTYGGS